MCRLAFPAKMTGDYKRSTICINTKQAIAYLQECLEKASRTSVGNKKPVWVSVLGAIASCARFQCIDVLECSSRRWSVLGAGGHTPVPDTDMVCIIPLSQAPPIIEEDTMSGKGGQDLKYKALVLKIVQLVSVCVALSSHRLCYKPALPPNRQCSVLLCPVCLPDDVVDSGCSYLSCRQPIRTRASRSHGV